MFLYKASRPFAPLIFIGTGFDLATSRAKDLSSEGNFVETADSGGAYFGLMGVCAGDSDTGLVVGDGGTDCTALRFGSSCFLGGDGSRI